MNLKFITTSDGSHTLYLPGMDEQYHSVHGAITESKHVFIQNGYVAHTKENPFVFEIGFGTGLNALLTALSANEQKRPTTFYTIEKFPLDKDISDKLNYGNLISEEAEKILNTIHSCEWESLVPITNFFSLKKIKADLVNDPLENLPEMDIIYFDAFGPDKQPDMWQKEIFKKIYSVTATNGMLVTYSAKGAVRRSLATCGFEMERLPGPPGKFQMLRGIKKDSKS